LKARTRRAFLVIVAIATFAGLVASVATGESNPFAGGHGNLISGGELRTFSFSAVQHPDGTVSGQVQVKNRALNVEVHVDVDCLKFEAGNRAIAGGTITRSSDPAFIAPGRISVFGVEDNGEGAAASADRITTIPDYAPPKSCNEFTFVGDTLREIANPSVVVRALTPITSGNIQVQP
jgi:hypothetical protein